MYTAHLDLSSLPVIANPNLLCGDNTLAQLVQKIQGFTDPTTLCAKMGPLSHFVCNVGSQGPGSAVIDLLICSPENGFYWYLYSEVAFQLDSGDPLDGTYSSSTYTASWYPGQPGGISMPSVDGTLLPPCCRYNCYTQYATSQSELALDACIQVCESAAVKVGD